MSRRGKRKGASTDDKEEEVAPLDSGTSTHAPDFSWRKESPALSINKAGFGNLSSSQSAMAACSAFKNVKELSSGARFPGPNSGGSKLKSRALYQRFSTSIQEGRGLPFAGIALQPSDKCPRPKSPSTFEITSSKVPLDLSLKKTARVLSLSSLHWCHQISSTSQCRGLKHFTELPSSTVELKHSTAAEYRPDGLNIPEQVAAGFWEALHSWVHPPSSLPPNIISAVRGAGQETTFYAERSRMWEAALQSLYYMFRGRQCSIFYVCSQNFVILFVGGVIGGRCEDACSAFLTRSTRGLRALLSGEDVQFTTPLLKSDVSPTTGQELLDLIEFEKIRPGQTRLVDSLAAFDNSVSSILAFDGPKNVHSLYDFILNQRFLAASSATGDVPMLLSPTPFEHATLTKPELSCKQMQCSATLSQSGLVSREGDTMDMVYTLDLKGMVLAPWVVSRICTVLDVAQPRGFDISFSTEPLTEGLNIAQEHASGERNFPNLEKASCYAEEIPYSSPLGRASVAQLKRSTNCWVASARINESRTWKERGSMAGSEVTTAGGTPVTTSAVLLSSWKHINARCASQNRAFLECKRVDADPEKCLPQGQKVTRCVVSLLKELHGKCPKAMDEFTRCMDYYSGEFKLCREEQQEFESACSVV